MTAEMIQFTVTFLANLLVSSGFWVFVQKKGAAKNASTKLLLGLACDRILDLGMRYIDRGMITADEYENLEKYLFKPYADLGGNGLAERVMNDVKKLPICQGKILTEDERKSLVQLDCIPRPGSVPSAESR